MRDTPASPLQRDALPAVEQRILDHVAASGGSSISGVRNALQLSWGVLYHHLHRLHKAGLVHIETAGRRRIVYARPPREQDVAHQTLLMSRPTRAVAAAVAERPGTSVLDLCDATGTTPRVVYYHLRKLVEAGLLITEGAASRRGLRPTPRLLELLKKLEGGERA